MRYLLLIAALLLCGCESEPTPFYKEYYRRVEVERHQWQARVCREMGGYWMRPGDCFTKLTSYPFKGTPEEKMLKDRGGRP